MTTLKYIHAGHRGVLEVAGSDARPFLQGVVTNDVTKIAPDRAIYAAMLSPQGRLLFDFFATEGQGERLLLESACDRLLDFSKRLALYRLRAKVEIADLSDVFSVFVFPGRRSLDSLELSAAPGAARPIRGGVVYTDPRLADMGARAILPAAEAAETLASLGAAAGDWAEYERLRLKLGVPEGSVDLPPEQALPMESGLNELHALDWDKGCYMGQELTARMKYRGLIKKRLIPVEVDGPMPKAGTPIFLGDKEVGDMRSGADGLAIAYLRLEAVESGAHLSAGEAQLFPRAPQWLDPSTAKNADNA